MSKEELETREKRCVDTDCPILSINNQNMRRVAELEEKAVNLEYLLEGRDNEIDELKEQNTNLQTMLKAEREVRCNEDYLKRVTELETQIEKMKCLNEEIIKALNECLDYEWLHAHNGKAKYLYLQTVIDIVNEKFEEIKEK